MRYTNLSLTKKLKILHGKKNKEEYAPPCEQFAELCSPLLSFWPELEPPFPASLPRSS